MYEQVFAFVLDLVDAQGLLNGQTVAVDSTLLEANAAMKAIVRKDTGEDWNEYLTQLMREVRSHRGGPSCLIGERAEPVSPRRRARRTSLAPSASAPNERTNGTKPTDEERRRFDKQRAKSRTKKVSNKDWESPVDADARIVRKQPKPPTDEGGERQRAVGRRRARGWVTGRNMWSIWRVT